jgi:hypothetical protein
VTLSHGDEREVRGRRRGEEEETRENVNRTQVMMGWNNTTDNSDVIHLRC